MIFKLEEKIKDRNQRKVMIDADYCAEHLLKDHTGILGALSVQEADKVIDVFNKIMKPVEYLLMKKALKGKYTDQDVIDHLAAMNIVYLGGISYVPAFTRTVLTDDLVKADGFQPSSEILFRHDLKRWMRVVNAQNGLKLE